MHVVPAAGDGPPRRLTDVPGGVSEIAWRPDGEAIAFTADPRDEADRQPRSSIWEVPLAGGDPREILALAGPVGRAAYSPDGRWIAGVGVDDPDSFDDVSPTLFVGPADGSSRAAALAPDLDRPVGNWADTDLTGWMMDSHPGPPGTGRTRWSRWSRTAVGPTPGASRSTHRPAGPRATPSAWCRAT